MDIFTSSFNKSKGLDPSKYLVVSISRFPPKWFQGVRCFEFAPSMQLLNDFHDGMAQCLYAYRYRYEVLERGDVHKVFEWLAGLSKGRDIVLCCFEPAGRFCHRRLLADYVKEVWGYSINELVS